MSEQTNVVIEFGAIAKLVRLIRSPTSSDDLKQHVSIITWSQFQFCGIITLRKTFMYVCVTCI